MAKKSTALYSQEKVSEFKTALKGLADNPKGFSAKEVVQQLSKDILLALESGHTWADVATVFCDRGLSVKESTIKRYIRESGTSTKRNSKKAEPDAQENSAVSKPVQTPVTPQSSFPASSVSAPSGFVEMTKDEDL